MKSSLLFVSLLILAIINYNCTKEENKIIETIPPAGDYFPLSIGSFWNYGPYRFHGSNTGLTAVAGSKNYSVFEYTGALKSYSENCSIFDTCLFRKENGKYYQSISTDFLPFPLDTKGHYEFVFMEDNAPVGTIWNNSTATGTYTFSNGVLRVEQSYIGRIESYLPSFKVINATADDSVQFKDVVKVHMKILAKGFDDANKSIFNSEEHYYKWYARNIGLIKTQHSGNNIFNMSITNFRVL